MSELPTGWVTARVVDLLSVLPDGRNVHQGWSPQCESEASPDEQFWGVLKTTAIQDGKFLFVHNKRLPTKLVERPLLEVSVGDLLITCAGPRTRCGVACLVRLTRRKLMISGKMYRMRIRDDGMDARYVEAALRMPATKVAIDEMKTGMSDSGMNLTHARFARLEIPLAPSSQQRRIADKLDAVLVRVDACRERLDRLQGILKRFRQSVLAAATSGGLTEEWREQQGASDDWLDCDVQAIAQVGTGSTPLRSNQNFFASTGTPWITSAATSQSVVLFANEFVTEAAIAAHRLRKFPVGTLLVAMYGEGKTRGQVTELGIEATINQACAAVVVDPRRAMKNFVKLALKANYLEMRDLAEGGNQPNLNLSKVKSFPLSLPPMAEQAEIVRRVESLFAWADRLEDRHAAARARVERLTPSLLAKAFRGELVAQDPADEPASELLKRLAQRPPANPTVSVKRQGAKPYRAKASQAASNVREESSS